MRKLDKPTETAAEVFLACISIVQNADLKRRLASCENSIVLASKEFEMKAPKVLLHTIQSASSVNGVVSTDEMSKVYTLRMAKKNTPGRAFYDKLLALPKHGRCPLCGQRIVTTLDHHLAKANYPALAVAPLNLVPACADCNKIKLNLSPNSSEEETIHPYFDDIEGDLWLKAKVIQGSAASFSFFVESPNFWSETLFKRVKYHFAMLNLSSLYGSHAAEELINIKQSVCTLFDVGGHNGVKLFLLEARNSRMLNHVNSWQTAMYTALADSDWFCNGGFKI